VLDNFPINRESAFELAMNSDVQEKLRAELLDAFPDPYDVDLVKLLKPYLNDVIQASMQLYPIVPVCPKQTLLIERDYLQRDTFPQKSQFRVSEILNASHDKARNAIAHTSIGSTRLIPSPAHLSRKDVSRKHPAMSMNFIPFSTGPRQ
jgi:hypothetical protein